jgi:hypothetical protein
MDPIVFYYLVIIGVSVAMVTVCFLKGKVWMGCISLLIGGPFVTIFGVSRLAKPDSWWARKYYDPTQLARARARFGGTSGPSEYVPPPVAELFR